ncbi:MAG TPA: cytochrome c [Burkholderiales bacterium]|nr:cytochrome c [Burkholderiales bacterium]
MTRPPGILRRALVPPLAAALLLVTAAAPAAEDPVAAMLSQPCAACHGTRGASQGPTTPIIAGLSKEFIVESMRGFKAGHRPSTVMGRIARGYSDAQFQAMGEYFSQQEFTPALQQMDGKLAARGKQVHERQCKKCRQDNGRDFAFKEAPGPILAGQWLDYLYISMREFLGVERDMPQRMGQGILNLRMGDVEALIHFYAGQN